MNSLLKVNLPEALSEAGFILDPAIVDMYKKFADFAHAEAEVEMGVFTDNDYFRVHAWQRLSSESMPLKMRLILMI